MSRFDGERHQAIVRERHKPVLTVRYPFRAKGKSFPAGTYAVEPEVAAELRDWQAKMEADAEQHDWDAPAGYCPENWPPFTLDGMQ